MIIKRTINGTEVEIELTTEEMRNIYWEMRDDYTLEDFQSRYQIPKDKEDEVVDRFNDALGCNDGFWESYWLAIEYVCEEMGLEEKEEE